MQAQAVGAHCTGFDLIVSDPQHGHGSSGHVGFELFAQLHVWDTEHNNGLLIYLLLADRAVEIVADRGIHAKVGTDEWTKIWRQMEAAFKQSDYEAGVLAGVQTVTEHLVKHFPASGPRRNELPNKPVVL